MASLKILKFVTSENIYRVKENPTTFTGLQTLLQSFFGTGTYQVSYQDEEGDQICISNDLSLFEAYESSEQKTLKLFIKKEGEKSMAPSQTPRESIFSCDSSFATVSQESVQQKEKVQSKMEQDFQVYGESPSEIEKGNEEELAFSKISIKEEANTYEQKQEEDIQTKDQSQTQENNKKLERKMKVQKLKNQNKNLKDKIKLLESQVQTSQKENKKLKKAQKRQLKQQQQQTFEKEVTKQPSFEQQENDFRSNPQGFSCFNQTANAFQQSFNSFQKEQQQNSFQQPVNHQRVPFFMQKIKMLLENNIRPEFDRMGSIIIQELRNQQLQGMKQDELNKSVHTYVRCDGCNTYPIVGVRYKCAVCQDFDFCMQCENQIQHPHAFIKIKDPSKAPKAIFVAVDEDQEKKLQREISQASQSQSQNQSMNSKPCQEYKPFYKAKLVEHLTYTINSKVEPGQIIQKQWKVKNIGRDVWPQNTVLKFVKGNLSTEICQVPSLKPQEEGIISMKIIIPNLEGRFEGVYKFCTPKGQMFGKKLLVKVISAVKTKENQTKLSKKEVASNTQKQINPQEKPVESVQNVLPQQKTVQVQVQAPSSQQSELEQQIDYIAQMVFYDREVIKLLILEHNGDLNQVLNDLLNMS